MKKKRYNLYACIPAVLIMLLIFYFSSRTGAESKTQSDSILDKLVFLRNFPVPRIFFSFLIRKAGHILEYALLSISLWFAFIKNNLSFRISVISVILAAYFYALTDELHQFYVPGRSAEFRDTLIDLLGILLGISIVWIFRKLNFIRTKTYGKSKA